ncbi:hypothetical protein GCM10027445_23650 [Amycolatopsis endophytica]
MAAVLVVAAAPVVHAELAHGEQTYTASGTFTPPGGVTSVFVAVWGAGGAGSAAPPQVIGGETTPPAPGGAVPPAPGDGTNPPAPAGRADPVAGTGGGGGGAAWCSVAVTPATEYTITVGAGGLAEQPDSAAGGESSVGVPGSPAMVVAHGGEPGTAEAAGKGGTADCGTSPGLVAAGTDGDGAKPGTAGVIPSAPPSGIGAGGAPGQPGAPGYVYLWW